MNSRLDRALRALRETEKGTHPGAEETLQRVLAERATRKRAWRRRVRLWMPIAAVLAFSTAALARWGSVDGLRALLSTEHGPASAPRRSPAQAPQLQAATDPPRVSELPAEAAGPRSELAAKAEPSVTSAGAPSAVAGAAPRLSSIARAAPQPSAVPRSTPSASPPPPPPPTPRGDGVLSEESITYRRAHRLHFDGDDPAESLRAWDEYLARFPDGRFAPDARYNRAIDLLKLRRFSEARAALEPFENGAFGAYHQGDARELLRSIR